MQALALFAQPKTLLIHAYPWTFHRGRDDGARGVSGREAQCSLPFPRRWPAGSMFAQFLFPTCEIDLGRLQW